MVETDEGPRKDTSLERLAKLKPAFQKDGKVTAGNASSLNDGAGAVLVACEEWAKKQGKTPLARVLGYSTSGVAPKELFHAPALAESVESTMTSKSGTLYEVVTFG